MTLDESCEKTFLVKSSNVNDIHIVYLENENSFPSCTWADWRKSLLPCKHMLSVIIKAVQRASWNSLFQKYRSSPFFQLDKEVIFSQHESEIECDAKNNEKNKEEVLEGDVLLEKILKNATLKDPKLPHVESYLIRAKRNIRRVWWWCIGSTTRVIVS